MSRKFIRLFALFAMLVGTVAAPINATQPQPSTPEQALIDNLEQATNGDVTVSYHRGTGKVRFLGTTQANPIARPATLAANANAETTARAYLSQFGSLFGITDQANQVAVIKRDTLADGRSKVRFQQVYNSVPVIAGELNVNLNARGELLSITGEVIPNLSLRSVTPKINLGDAQELARTLVSTRYESDADTLRVKTPELVIYNPTLIGAPSVGISSLAWRIDVEGFAHDEPIREYVVIDAELGMALLNFNRIAHAKERHVCNSNNTPDIDGNANTDCATPVQYVRNEGDGPNADSEVNLAYDYSGQTYDFFMAHFNRDSIDDAGMPLISLVKYCPNAANCPYPNAFWNGTQMTYGDTFAGADDVVAHELTHGVTEHSSNLLYYYQAGAINEAMSDIFGEFMDLTNGQGTDIPAARWLMGEDLPIGAIRDMQDPPAGGQPDRMLSPLYVLDPSQADNGGVHSNSGVANKAAYLLADGDTFNGYTITSLGITKTAQIFYETEINLLTSGSDYADLGDSLRAACFTLIGQHGITFADCLEVDEAVLATEMDLMPTNAPAPDVTVCELGQTPQNRFYDSFEFVDNTSWMATPVTGVANNWTSSAVWFSYATEGSSQAENGNSNYIDAIDGITQREDSALAMTFDVAVPTTTTAYVHFNHAYDFDSLGGIPTEGGVVEYSTDSGATWNDAAALITFNGYNGYIDNINNDLDNRQAFTGISNGYGSTRLNLSSLGGQSVRFRFRGGLDDVVRARYFSWDVDEFRIYTCAGPDVPTAPTAIILSDVTVEQGTGPITTSVATVSDAKQTAGSLDISLEGAPAGLTLAYTNTNGLVTVFATCACDVPVGTYPITLTVMNDANLSTTSVFNVEVSQAGYEVTDPGFEQGSVSWNAYSSSFDDSIPPLCNTAACAGQPRTGSGWLRFGALSGNADTSFAEQVLTTGEGDVTIEFYLNIYAHNGRGASDFVRLLVDGNEVFRVTDANTEYDSGFVKVSIPLTNVTEGSHTVRFESTTGASGVTDIVRFSIDDFTVFSENHQCKTTQYVLYLPSILK